MPEQVRTHLALFEVAQEDAVDAAHQQSGQISLALAGRQPPKILAVAKA